MTPADLLLARHHSGDPAAGAALLHEFEPLCRSLAYRWRRSWIAQDDLLQTARLAVWVAIDPNASTPFELGRGCLTLWIKTAVGSALQGYVSKAAYYRSRLVYLDDPDDDGMTLGDTIPAQTEDAAEVVDVDQRIAAMRRHVDGLLPVQRDVVARRLAGETLRVAGEALGVTYETVRLREARAFRNIRRAMFREETSRRSSIEQA